MNVNGNQAAYKGCQRWASRNARQVLLAVSLSVLAAGPAVAVDPSTQEFSVSARVPAPSLTFNPDLSGEYPFHYDRSADEFQDIARDIHITSRQGGVQVSQAHPPVFLGEDGQVNNELEMFITVGGARPGVVLPESGEPVVVMEKSGYQDVNFGLHAMKKAQGERLTPGVYTAAVSFVFEVIQP